MMPTIAYAVGACAASVCTSETDEVATRMLNDNHPTGLEHGWEVDPAPFFADGVSTNPLPCPDDPGRRHILFRC